MPTKSRKQIIRIRLQRYLRGKKKYREILGFTMLVSPSFFDRLADFEKKVKRWIGSG